MSVGGGTDVVPCMLPIDRYIQWQTVGFGESIVRVILLGPTIPGIRKSFGLADYLLRHVLLRDIHHVFRHLQFFWRIWKKKVVWLKIPSRQENTKKTGGWGSPDRGSLVSFWNGPLQNYIEKRLEKMRGEGNKGRGRPRKIWENCVSKDLREKYLGGGEDLNRTAWRRLAMNAEPTRKKVLIFRRWCTYIQLQTVWWTWPPVQLHLMYYGTYSLHCPS